jgi:hypothetical protein
MTGRREYVARAGASSISVQMIVCGVMISPFESRVAKVGVTGRQSVSL